MSMNGHAFERRVIAALGDLGCTTETSDFLDHVEKVDFIVTRIDRRPLALPVEVQLTLQPDHVIKLAGFVRAARSRGPKGTTIPLYIEADHGIKPRAAAVAIKWELLHLLGFGHDPEAPAYAARITREGIARPFDPCLKIGQLLVLASDPRAAPSRKTGVVIDIEDMGFLIKTEGGLYRASDCGVVDLRVHHRIRDHRRAMGSAFGLVVRFLSSGKGVPHPVAYSVTNAWGEAVLFPSVV